MGGSDLEMAPAHQIRLPACQIRVSTRAASTTSGAVASTTKADTGSRWGGRGGRWRRLLGRAKRQAVVAGTAGSSSLARRDKCRLLHLKSTIERGTGGGDERRNEKEEEVEGIWVSRGYGWYFSSRATLGRDTHFWLAYLHQVASDFKEPI